MASNQLTAFLAVVIILLLEGNKDMVVEAQLSEGFYSSSCPFLLPTVRTAVSTAVLAEPRMGASLLRLFYLDCFVKGCDASILLDDTSSFTGEQTSPPNHNSVRGFNVIDNIKSAVELVCPRVVSCADILAIAARYSVELLGGPSWPLYLGRRDATTASYADPLGSIPPPFSSQQLLTNIFAAYGFTTQEMVALLGAHTIGQSKCRNFRDRIYNDNKDEKIDPPFAAALQIICPRTSDDENLAPLDSLTPLVFDNSYFRNLLAGRGLLHSDQELTNGASTASWVHLYSYNLTRFRTDFAAAMLKMSQLGALTRSEGEIRQSCGKIN